MDKDCEKKVEFCVSCKEDFYLSFLSLMIIVLPLAFWFISNMISYISVKKVRICHSPTVWHQSFFTSTLSFLVGSPLVVEDLCNFQIIQWCILCVNYWGLLPFLSGLADGLKTLQTYTIITPPLALFLKILLSFWMLNIYLTQSL